MGGNMYGGIDMSSIQAGLGAGGLSNFSTYNHQQQGVGMGVGVVLLAFLPCTLTSLPFTQRTLSTLRDTT